MMKFNKAVSSVIILSFLISYSNSLAAPREPQQRGENQQPSARQQALQARRQQFEQEATAAGPEIDTEYAKYVGYVNSGKIPDDANVREGLRFITKNKKFVSILNKQHKGGTYYALSSWVFYFDNKPDRVQKQIAEGIKVGAVNPNFIHTAYAISILNRDYNSIQQVSSLVEKSTSEDSNAAESPESSYSQPTENTLNIDVNNLNTNVLGKDISALTMGNDKVVLSILLWQVDANELERFAPPPPPAEHNEPNDANNPQPPAEQAPPQEQQTFEPVPMPDLVAFSNLTKRYNKNPKTVFVGINFNDPSKIKNVENWITKNPQPWQSAPPLAKVQQLVTSIIGQRPTKPMLLIAGPDKKIRYAGDVNGVLPNMIIQKILTNPQEFAEPNDANAPAKKAADANSQIEMMKPTSMDSNQSSVQTPQSQPQQPQTQTASPNSIPAQQSQVAPQTQTQQNTDSGDFTEVDYQAQKDLEYAKQLFKIGDRLQYHTYAKPIDLCRNIISKYPNTKYAQEARVLMRQVPERFRERYHITDAELGL
jgi:hypothetical protein